MIDTIRLQNFQKWDDLTVKLGPGVNTITGPSGAGKSVLFRAIKWLVLHEPITGFQKHGTKETRVGINTDAGAVIRLKTASKYGYRVNGQELVACKTEQPEVVSSILRLGKENLASQFDPPYLLTCSPGEMAKSLNRIVDLSSIDVGIAEINRRSAKQKTVVEYTEAEAKAATEAREKLDWVEQCYLDAEYVAGVETQAKAQAHALAEIRALVSQIRGLSSEIGDGKTVCKAIRKHLGDVEELAVKASRATINRIAGCVQEITVSEDKLTRATGIKAALETVYGLREVALQKAEVVQEYRALIADIKKIGDLDGFREASLCILQVHKTAKEAQARAQAVKDCVVGIEDVVAQLAEQEAARDKVKEELGSTCPTCGQLIHRK